MSSWNGLDFFIFLIFALNTFLGMSRGATREIISMMCLSLALIITIKFTVPLAMFMMRSPLIRDVLDSNFVMNFMIAIGANTLTENFIGEVAYTVSLLICFVGAFSACEATMRYSRFVEMYSFPYAAVSGKVGGALGFTRGYIINLLIILILSQHLLKSDPTGAVNSVISGSFFVNLFQGSARKLDRIIGAQDVERYRDIYNDKNLYNEGNVFKTLNGGGVTNPVGGTGTPPSGTNPPAANTASPADNSASPASGSTPGFQNIYQPGNSPSTPPPDNTGTTGQ